MTEPSLRAVVGELPEPLRHMGGYHFGWWDSEGTPTAASSGKSIRAALFFAAASACGAAPQSLATAAAAIELVHNFTLLHDDVMDRDRTRRGRETVWSLWGIPDAILLGDAMHAAAGKCLVTSPRTAIGLVRLEDAVIELCRGQQEDCAFESIPPANGEEYSRMAMGKTGALMGAACALGAELADGDQHVVAAMDTFGRQVGVSFQIVDDLIGIWGDPAVTGKPVGNDLVNRKQTMPIVVALRSGTPAGTRLQKLYELPRALTPEEVSLAAELVEESGGRRAAQELAERLLAQALAALPGELATTDLITLAGVVAHRDR